MILYNEYGIEFSLTNILLKVINMKFWIVSKRLLFVYSLVALFITSIFYVNSNVVLTSSTTDRKIPIYSVNRTDNKVAITFDVAWDDNDVKDILSVLDKYKIKASFFIVGEWMDKYPESTELIHNKGHEIVNHSDTHPYMTKLSQAEMEREILDCDAKIYKVTGKKLGLFRPPYGDYNNDVVTVADSVDHKVIQWDVDSLDWQDLSAQEICNRVTSKVKSGSIILLHVGAKNTPGALPLLLEKLNTDGYKPVKVSEIIYKNNYYIDHTGMQIKNTEN